MTETSIDRNMYSAVDIIAYKDKRKKDINRAGLFFKEDMTMTTTENVPVVSLNNCQNVEVHSQDPNEVIVTSSENCTVHIYSDRFNSENPIKQSPDGNLSIDKLHNNNCEIVYHPKSDFPSEYTLDTCTFYKDGEATAHINAEMSGKITTSTGKTFVGSK